jgi:chromosome segregation and condensation protein ScpB
VDAVLLKKDSGRGYFRRGQPMNIEQLGLLFDEAERPSNSDMRVVLDELKAEYAERGVELKEVASGFRFQVRQETGPWVSRLWDEKAITVFACAIGNIGADCVSPTDYAF